MQGQGLIAAAGSEGSLYSGERVESEQSTSSSAAAGTQVPVAASAATRRSSSSDVKLLALDMDGTLLDSQSKVLPSSVKALKAALAAGVLVCLATGKARPAAMSAMARVGLAGTRPRLPGNRGESTRDLMSSAQSNEQILMPSYLCAGEGLVIWSRGPGLFLQGLAVHGRDGTLLEGTLLGSNMWSGPDSCSPQCAVITAATLKRSFVMHARPGHAPRCRTSCV